MPPLSLFQTLRDAKLTVTGVNGSPSVEIHVDFNKKTMRVKTQKDTHYFKDIDQEIVYSQKVACSNLRGDRVSIELGPHKVATGPGYPVIRVPRGHSVLIRGEKPCTLMFQSWL